MHFGLTDRQGRPKPQLEELARFARLVGRLEAGGFAPVPADTLIVVPEHFERVVSFMTPSSVKRSTGTSSSPTSPLARRTCRRGGP